MLLLNDSSSLTVWMNAERSRDSIRNFIRLFNRSAFLYDSTCKSKRERESCLSASLSSLDSPVVSTALALVLDAINQLRQSSQQSRRSIGQFESFGHTSRAQQGQHTAKGGLDILATDAQVL